MGGSDIEYAMMIPLFSSCTELGYRDIRERKTEMKVSTAEEDLLVVSLLLLHRARCVVVFRERARNMGVGCSGGTEITLPGCYCWQGDGVK